MSTSSTYSYEVYSTLFFIYLGHNHKWYTKTLSQSNHKFSDIKMNNHIKKVAKLYQNYSAWTNKN